MKMWGSGAGSSVKLGVSGADFCYSGQVKMSFWQVFILSNLYFICPNGQVVIKTYVAPC